jgi:hypothetical protein
MSDASPPIHPAAASTAAPQPRATTTAAGNKQKKKKKPPSKGGDLLDLQSSKVYTFIRKHVFDTDKFTGQAILDTPQYTDEATWLQFLPEAGPEQEEECRRASRLPFYSYCKPR